HSSTALSIDQCESDGVRSGGHFHPEAARVVDLDLCAVEREIESHRAKASSAKRELVFGVEWECVMEHDAAARAERQPIDVTVLRKSCRWRERRLRRRKRLVADR